eukprot:s435_g14.t2
MGSGSSARQKAYAQGKDVPKSENSGILATRPAEDPTELIIHAISGGSQKTLAEKKKKKQEKQATLLAMDCNAPTLQRPSSARSRHSGEPRELLIPTVKSGASLEPPQSRHSQRSNRSLSSGSEEEEEVRNRQIFSRVHTDTSRQYLRKHYTRRQSDPGSPTGEDSVEAQAEILNRRCSAGDVRRQEAPKSRPGSKQSNLRPGSKQHPSRQGSKESNQLSTQDKLPNGVWSATIQEGSGKKQKTRREERRPCSASHEGTVNGFVKPPKVEWTENYSWGSMLVKLKFHRTEPWLLEGHFETSDATQGKITLLHERLKSLVHYYDPLGRFVCMRNSMIERVGVVRSLLPSQFGPWWELDVTFLARQDSPSQLILLLPVGPSGDALASLEAWAGFQKEPSSVVRGAIVGPSDGVRDRPRKFPHPGHGIQEWAEAAISSGADDSVSMFFEGASSDDEVEESSFVTCLGCHMSKSVEELLAQLDRDEAREWEALRPSTRVEVGGGSVPSIEERSECGVSVLSRGNRPRAVAANFTGDSRSSKKQDRRSKLNLLRSDLEARVDTQISARFREQPAPGREMESKLRSLRLDLEGKVVTISEGKIQSLEDRLESRMVKSRVDLEETLESFIGDRLESLRKECHEDAKGYCQDVQDYYEFTPGILRGLCDEKHLETLQVTLEDALQGMAVKHLRGQVIELDAHCASVAFEDGTRGTVDFDFAVIAVCFCPQAGTPLWKGANATTLAARRAQLQQTRQQLAERAANAGRVVLLGAGLVGVELAAELVEHFPQLRRGSENLEVLEVLITLVDRTAEVLPLLPPDAQDYARKWLDAKEVDLRLGEELPLEQQQLLKALQIDEALVLPCAGVRFPGGQLVSKLLGAEGDPTGQICTNRAMQCVREGRKKRGKKMEVRHVFEQIAHFGGDGVPLASGHIFALGDCARGDLQEIPSRLQEMTLCSLGPHDCIHVMNGRVVSSGWLAAQLKHQVEVTKMGDVGQLSLEPDPTLVKRHYVPCEGSSRARLGRERREPRGVGARLSDDLVAMQQRLVSELRAETTLALNRESAAIAALDEQLWITDQRLGQRIDDLEQVRVRERGSVKNGRVLSSILSETLEETRDLEMEPTTHEAADRRAKRVSKGVLADAQLAARSMMEECRTDDVRGGGLLPRRGREVTTSTRLRSFEDEGLGRLRSTRLGTGGALGMASKAAEPFASRARYD